MKITVRTIILGLLFATFGFSSENMGDFIFHHIGNSEKWQPIPGMGAITIPGSHYEIFGFNMGITLHVFMMFVAAILMIVLFKISSKRKNLTPTSKFGHAIEALVIYIRDDLVVPNVGKKDAQKWLPFFLTLFFFILTLNLIGMIPSMSTTTANINFTAAMTLLIFVTFNGAGMFKNGPIKYFLNLVPSGIPAPVLIILAPIEIIGLITKAVALAIRLFANMAAGHIIILSLLGLISVLSSHWVAVASVPFSLFISLIEVLVAFLQAYVFTLLATLFVGMSIHQEH